MKNHQDNANAQPALLRAAGGVDTLETNSLCCVAAGIIAPSSATAEALIPHKKLRGAALADATLNAQERQPAQPVVGYTHAWAVIDPYDEVPMQCKGCGALGSRDHTDTGPCPTPYKTRRELLSALAALEQDKARLWDHIQALQIDSDCLNEQLLDLLSERDSMHAMLNHPKEEPVVTLQLVSYLTDGLHIRKWENPGRLNAGTYNLYLRPAAGEIERLEKELAEQNTKLAELAPNAARYQWLRERDLETIQLGGVFAGSTPENIALNNEDLDQTIDMAMAEEVVQ